MGNTICTAGFPSPAIASSCFTARCASIWYGFFIATLLFLGKRKLLSAYQKASSGESLLSTIYRAFPYHPGESFPSPGSCEQRRLAPPGGNQTTADPFFGVCRLTVEPCRTKVRRRP